MPSMRRRYVTLPPFGDPRAGILPWMRFVRRTRRSSPGIRRLLSRLHTFETVDGSGGTVPAHPHPSSCSSSSSSPKWCPISWPTVMRTCSIRSSSLVQ